MTIDCHTHVVPPDPSFGQSGDPRWPRLAAQGEEASVVIGGRPFRTVARAAWDMASRLRAMDAERVQMHVLSLMPELLNYWAPPADAEAYCRAANAWLAAQVKREPERFMALGTLPLQDPDLATRLLADVKDAGLVGIEVGTRIGAVPAYDHSLLAFYQEAARLGLVVFAHAFKPPELSHLPPGPLGAAVAFPPDIAQCAGGFIATGILERIPSLRLLFSHGGGGISFSIGRLDRVWRATGTGYPAVNQAPSSTLRNMYFDSLVFSRASLGSLIDAAGVTQVVVGSDFPFLGCPASWSANAVRGLRDAATVITTENALRLFDVT